ncbi:hypothetical protein HOLleu_18506 [Holothuria leucospilota]|uniref:Uncharacterized protein n=1 Tax=Holothuria leucospilota TaxID=206669 RepID=A0A9Q1H9H5_HOLLE|nr:hypothetical protein HOLleu_18506 [Holothuria leucospilota]
MDDKFIVMRPNSNRQAILSVTRMTTRIGEKNSFQEYRINQKTRNQKLQSTNRD